jgi:tetraacyldisaccharide 4'-kinase
MSIPRASDAGPLPRWLAPVARLGETLYRVEINRRNRRFDRGAGVTRLDRPVISVGNLSIGGTGKTPMVARLAGALAQRGHRPCIAMRGYTLGGRHGPASDESRLYAGLLPGVPVVTQPDRAAGLRALFASEHGRDVDCVVLDDGFQHRRLARDLDIVLLDASRDTFVDRLLPAGWLREPVSSLARAGAIVVTHAELVAPGAVERLLELVRGIAPRAAQAVARHEWADLAQATGDVEQRAPLDWLNGKTVVVVCAIGNPSAFLARAAACPGIVIADRCVLPDHDPYGPRTVNRIVDLARRHGAGAILTTEKDWCKLRSARARWPCEVVRPRLEMTFDRGWDALITATLGAVLRRPS